MTHKLSLFFLSLFLTILSPFLFSESLGIVIDGYSKILEGLKAEEVIVIQGQNSLGDGSFVKIVGEESPFVNESEEPSSSSL